MNEVKFVFDGNYLVAELEDTSLIINYQMEMLIHTEVKYLLPVKRQMKNNILYLYYDLAGKTSLNRLVSHKKMPDSSYVEFVKSTLRAMTELEEYQLSAEGIVLDDNYIFVHPTDYVPYFVYLPLQSRKNGISNVVAYLKNMLVSDIVEIRNSNVMQQTISILNSGAGVHDMLMQIERLRIGSMESVKNNIERPIQPTYEQASVPVQRTAPQAPVNPVPMPTPKAQAPIQQQAPTPTPNQGVSNKGIAIPGGGSVPIKPVAERKEKKLKESTAVEGGKPDMKKITPILVAIAAAIVVAFAALFASGTFTDDDGNTDYTGLIGIPILAFAADYFVYTKLKVKFVTDGAEQEEAAKPKKMPAGRKQSKEVVVPAKEVVVPAQAVNQAPMQSTGNDNVGYGYAQPQQYGAPAPQNNIPSQPAFWGDNGDSGETEILVGGISANPYLQARNGATINIKGQITRIGKLRNQVDAVISNPKVSRVHADIIMRDGKMYVMDLGSANGTYINGNTERINVNTEYELHNNDRVVFANEEYTVHC
jgi:hypothetical protein